MGAMKAVKAAFLAATLSVSAGAFAAQPGAAPPQPCQKACLGLVELEIKQSSFSLDPFEHMKNAANASKITVPMFLKDYEQLKEGKKLEEQFRSGSFFLNGSVSWRNVYVKKKLGVKCE